VLALRRLGGASGWGVVSSGILAGELIGTTSGIKLTDAGPSNALASDSAYSPPVASGPVNASGASCTATASVYDAAYDENNVYVNFNQPYATATAAADGYSHSYQTNGSGYALIYLNGPPGARITVTVGSATCATSD
jgi:hypothetical protein